MIYRLVMYAAAFALLVCSFLESNLFVSFIFMGIGIECIFVAHEMKREEERQ